MTLSNRISRLTFRKHPQNRNRTHYLPYLEVLLKMLYPCRSHTAYQNFVSKRLPSFLEHDPAWVLSHSALIGKLWRLDLRRAEPFLKPLYAARGAPARDPTNLLRALLAMTHLRITSITRFVRRLKADRLLALCCGFDPNHPENLPGVGTFYDFFKRLWIGADGGARPKILPRQRKPREKFKPDGRWQQKHPGVLKRLAQRVVSRHRSEKRPEMLLQILLARVFVDVSVEKGLISPQNLVLAGDGTSLKSGGSSRGTKVCACRKKGILNCNCPRRYSDAGASWGWDSTREVFFWGRRLYELTAAGGIYDLPLYLRLGAGRRHDSVLAMTALAEARNLYPNLRFCVFTADAAHDATAIFEILNHWQIKPVIPLNERCGGHRSYQGPLKIDDLGRPICPAGYPMQYWGLDAKRSRLRWRCPKICARKEIRSQIVCNQPCSPSPTGRVVITKPKDDPRLFTPIPRASPLWQDIYRNRTAVERSFKRKKIDYNLEDARARSTCYWCWRAHLAAYNQHLDAWLAHEPFSLEEVLTPLKT